ncbi:MAG: carboxy-S-adenosyl-L-methionine synthase CmoA [Proteobacteria bacterium]|nr:carboxy-S-adenosyl-L-methionine synthase CmoA [Pseudomonadota bacterium]
MPPKPRIDRVFAHPRPVQPFAFDADVADAFADMAVRSIPGYDAIIRQIGAFARLFVAPQSRVYDLGCSLGAAILAVRESVGARAHLVAVDNSAAMIERLSGALSSRALHPPIEVRCEDAATTELSDASLVVLNFTLQFLDVPDKQPLLQRVYDALLPGGALVLSEKLTFSDAQELARIESLYYDFKRHNGYNELEIRQKRDALETALKLDTRQAHLERLRAVGFSEVREWFHCLNFSSFLAVR